MKRSERTLMGCVFDAKNKRGFSAGNQSLRLPALRPRLLGVRGNKRSKLVPKGSVLASKELGLVSKRSGLVPKGLELVSWSNLLERRRLKRSEVESYESKGVPKIVVLSTILGVFCGPVLAGLFLGETKVSAASLTLTIPENLSVSVDSSAGVAYKTSDKSNITIKTDAYAGYTLNIKSTDGTNVLKATDGKTINSIESPLDDYQASGAINSWAFLPGKLNSTNNSTYQPGPKADVLLGKSSNSNSEPDTYPISIAAKVDNNQPTGTYKNSFTITATANPVPYEITYDYNNGSGNISPNPQTGTGIEGSTIKLSDEVPTRSNYEFLGWCDTPTDNEQCSGTKYEKGGSYTLKNSDNKVVFYTIWKANGPPTTMQGFGDYCNSMTTGSTTTVTLTDTRDNNRYKVAKLKDGKCWMVENLRIAGKTISSTDSDMSSGSYAIPSSSTSGFSSSNYDNDSAYVDSTYGGYYSWHTATAGSGTQSMSSGTASSSICPKGWKLPTSGSTSGDFSVLTKAYGGSGNNESNSTVSTALRASPVPNFLFGGYYLNSSPHLVGSRSYYWSSSVVDSNGAYYLYLDTSIVNPMRNNNKYIGFSVRCIAKQ